MILLLYIIIQITHGGCNYLEMDFFNDHDRGQITYAPGATSHEPEFCKNMATRMQPDIVILECEHIERQRIVRAAHPNENGEMKISRPTPSITCVCNNALGLACKFTIIYKPSETFYYMEDVDGNPVITVLLAAIDFFSEYEHNDLIPDWQTTNFVPANNTCSEAAKRADVEHGRHVHHCDEHVYANLSVYLAPLNIAIIPGLAVKHCTCYNNHTRANVSFFLRKRARRLFYLLVEYSESELESSDDEYIQPSEHSNGHSNVHGEGPYLKLIGII